VGTFLLEERGNREIARITGLTKVTVGRIIDPITTYPDEFNDFMKKATLRAAMCKIRNRQIEPDLCGGESINDPVGRFVRLPVEYLKTK
jgi:hypothetical protein